ncbi:MAG: fasciclin domain-containing protein [Pseudomonadota bacterium]
MKRLMLSTALVSLIAAPAALAEPMVDADIEATPEIQRVTDAKRLVLVKNGLTRISPDSPSYDVQQETNTAPTREGETGPATIIDVASNDGRFDTLTQLVVEAGLTDALSGDGPFTVFAPTDEAFAKLPEAKLEYLASEDGRDELITILQAHVASGQFTSDRIPEAGLEVISLNETELEITREDDSVSIGDAKIIAADIETGNGVIHVIDSVILPDTA